MNTYEAILAAANHIENNPREFDWHSGEIPSAQHCGTPGCAMGWIGFFCGVKQNDFSGVEEQFLGLEPNCGRSFYREMDAITEHFAWTRNYKECARTLRIFAERYRTQPDVKPDAFKPWLASLMAKVEGELIPA